MKHIVEAFSGILFLSVIMWSCIFLIVSCGKIRTAVAYKSQVIAEIENSNFNDNVINACISGAEEMGYQLQVTNCTFDTYEDINTAEVILTYEYTLPLFDISVTKSTSGIAR